MQIDFHHAVTYVVARLAGFEKEEADVIAYSAQYVDDATNDGEIEFTNGAMYGRSASAHKTVDYRNFQKLANRRVWVPFHFLPGNGGKPAGENPSERFIHKLVCYPNSMVAQDMVAECIKRKEKPFALQLLGISAHVLADTFAHKGFAGVNHRINRVQDIKVKRDREMKKDNRIVRRLKSFFGSLFNDAASEFVSDALPLGHGAALSYPDLPYLSWKYKNGLGDVVERDNPTDFVEAANELCKMFQRFRRGDASAEVAGLPTADKEKIAFLLGKLRSTEGHKRHKRWRGRIAAGYFSFGPEEISYRAKGDSSWKHQALGTDLDDDKLDSIFEYTPEFLDSNWKRFHDALQLHRYYVVKEILPRYGISVA